MLRPGIGRRRPVAASNISQVAYRCWQRTIYFTLRWKKFKNRFTSFWRKSNLNCGSCHSQKPVSPGRSSRNGNHHLISDNAPDIRFNGEACRKRHVAGQFQQQYSGRCRSLDGTGSNKDGGGKFRFAIGGTQWI